MIIEYNKKAPTTDKKIESLMESVQMVVDTLQRSNESVQSKVDSFYPVGSIYISINPINPSYLFGGEWEQISDRFLFGAGDLSAAGDTGGEVSHTLSLSEMPSHEHPGNGWSFSVYVGTRSSVTVGAISGSGHEMTQVNSSGAWGGYANVPAAGGGQPHNNMPPYLTVYIWIRTK